VLLPERQAKKRQLLQPRFSEFVLRMRQLVLWLMEFVNLCRLVFELLECSIPTDDILPIRELTKA